jgi:hypothetical protein
MTFEFPRFPLPFIDALLQQPGIYFLSVLELVSLSKCDAPTRAALLNGRGVVMIERGVDGARL